MKKTEIIKKNYEFKYFFKKGEYISGKYIEIFIHRNKLDKNKLGIIVSKKVGNSVVRHRMTRLIRESYRLQESKFQNGFDIIVIARTNAKDKSYKEIESALIHLGTLHNIIDLYIGDVKIENNIYRTY